MDYMKLSSLAVFYALLVSACNNPSTTTVIITKPGQTTATINLAANVVINADSTGSTYYAFTRNYLVTVPSTIERTAGTALINGRGIGVDFGASGQCYWDVNTASPTQWVFETCTGGQIPGDTVSVTGGNSLAFWVYENQNSGDSTAAWAMQTTTD